MSNPVEGGAGGVGISAGASSLNQGNVTFSNSNGVTFGLNAGVMTATVTPGAAAGIAAVSVSNTTYTSGTIGFSNANGVTFGSSAGGAVTASVAAQTAQTMGLYASSQTTGQSSSSTVDARSLSIVGAGIVSVGNSAGSLIISATAGAGGGAAISAAGNSINAGTAVWSNSNNISFGMAGSTVTATVTVPAQTNQTMGVYASSQTTGQSSSTTVDARSLSLVGAGNISIGNSAGSVIISGAAGGQTNQTMGFYASSQTTGQSSSSTVDARSLTIVGYGVVSIGLSAGSLQISSPATTSFAAFSAGLSTGGNTLGNTGLVQNQLVLAGGNNITLSGSTNASSMTITISAGAGGAGPAVAAGTQTATSGTVVFSNSNNVTFGMSNSSVVTASASYSQVSSVGLYAVGNTTQNSSTTLDQRTLSYDGLGALTVGFSNGSVQLSAPATSSISGTGMISVSVNGSTISIGAAQPQMSFFQALPTENSSLTQYGVGTVQVYPCFQPEAFTATRADVLASLSVSSSSNSSHAGVISAYVGLYTLNVSTLSLASSGSQSFQWSNTSNNSLASISGVRRLSVPINVNYTGNQDLFVAFMSKSSSTNANWFTASNIGVTYGVSAQLQGLIGEASNNSKQFVPGMGIYSTTSAAMPASMGLSEISGIGSAGAPPSVLQPVQFANFTA